MQEHISEILSRGWWISFPPKISTRPEFEVQARKGSKNVSQSWITEIGLAVALQRLQEDTLTIDREQGE